jgi:hypothetical protein
VLVGRIHGPHERAGVVFLDEANRIGYLNADNRHNMFGGQKAQRSFMLEQSAQFNAQMAAMEDAHRERMEAQRQASAAQNQPSAAEESIEDAGADRAIALAEPILREIAAEVKSGA